MKYAIISDTHGNAPAFKAVIADAQKQNVDQFLLLGDYAASFPWGNDVVEIIRNIPNATVIKGNGEDYLINIHKNAQKDFSHKQFAPIYWGYQSQTAPNMEYGMNLPQTLTIGDIYLNHSLDAFYRTPPVEFFISNFYREMMNTAPFPFEEYIPRATAAILARPDAVADIMALPRGIHLFGHNHLQFHMEYEGRIFINPGSCGEPLDWNTAAPYTILEYKNGVHSIEERRVEYDLQATAQKLRESEYAAFAPAWSRIMELELFTGKDYFMPFVLHLVETSKAMGETEYPVSNKAFDAACETWDEGKY